MVLRGGVISAQQVNLRPDLEGVWLLFFCKGMWQVIVSPVVQLQKRPKKMPIDSTVTVEWAFSLVLSEKSSHTPLKNIYFWLVVIVIIYFFVLKGVRFPQ